MGINSDIIYDSIKKKILSKALPKILGDLLTTVKITWKTNEKQYQDDHRTQLSEPGGRRLK